MRWARYLAMAVLLTVALACLSAEWLAPAHYARQFREAPNAAPSREHPLGTDELGRDRFSRLLYGTRVSLVLAPAAALLSSLLAALLGGTAGYLGGWWERVSLAGMDLVLSLPWLFLLLTVRALLPLNVSPITSVVITFFLLGLLGWAAAARVVCAGVRSLCHSDFVLQARASGCAGWRLLLVHILPNLKPVLSAQFWIAVPVFILSEANLGMLGLGVAEPMPSWGNLLRGLENYPALAESPWMLAPLLLLVLVVGGFQTILTKEDLPA